MFEHGFTKIRISQETIVNPCELPLEASLLQNMGQNDILSSLEFSHICGHEVVPSNLCSLELKQGTLYIQ